MSIRSGALVIIVSVALGLTACGPSAEASAAARDRSAAEAAQQRAATDRAAVEAVASQAAVDRAAAEKAAADALTAKAAADKSLADAQAALKAATDAASAKPTAPTAAVQPVALAPTVAPFVQITGSSYGFVSAQVGPVVGPGLNPFCIASESYGFAGGGNVISSSHNGGTWTWQFSLVPWGRVSGVQAKNAVTCKWDDGTTRSASAFFPY